MIIVHRFLRYYLVLIKNFKGLLKSDELRLYLFIVFASTVLIALNIASSYDNIIYAFKDSFFAVSSIITTTGFATADFDLWPTFSKWILLLLMFVGGCAGSTAGGLKVSRILVSIKASINEVKKSINPNRKIALVYDGKPLDIGTERNILRYIVLYFIVYAVLLFFLSLDSTDIQSAFSSIAATFNNVGPGLGIVGPAGNYFHYNAFSKILLSFI